MSNKHILIGEKLIAVYIAEDGGAIRFDTDNKEHIIARADGECCSRTWIESVDDPDILIGAEIQSVVDIDMPNLGQLEGCDVVRYYGCQIITEKGSCVIDYRNDSNGYYGGNLSWPNEYYYGGVFGQNESRMKWKKLV